MYKIFLYLFIPFLLLSQQDTLTYEFTAEEVMKLYNSIVELEFKDSVNVELIQNLTDQTFLYEQKVENDSLIINQLNYQLEQKEVIIELLEPIWYDKPIIWYSLGIVTVFIIRIAAGV